MNAIFEAAIEVEAACRAAGFGFCFIGGLAVQRWGAPRMTADVDLTVITGFGTEAPYVDTLLVAFRGRIPDARDFALQHRTLLLAATNGVHLDVSLGAMPFEERTVERASAFVLLHWPTIWTELPPLLELREDADTEQRLRAIATAGSPSRTRSR